MKAKKNRGQKGGREKVNHKGLSFAIVSIGNLCMYEQNLERSREHTKNFRYIKRQQVVSCRQETNKKTKVGYFRGWLSPAQKFSMLQENIGKSSRVSASSIFIYCDLCYKSIDAIKVESSCDTGWSTGCNTDLFKAHWSSLIFCHAYIVDEYGLDKLKKKWHFFFCKNLIDQA